MAFLLRRMKAFKRARYSRLIGSVIGVTLVFLYVIVPLVFRYSPALQMYFVFVNKGQNGPHMAAYTLNDPEGVGLRGSRNFYLLIDGAISLGVWHILPDALISSAPHGSSPDNDLWYEKSLRMTYPIVLYLHGNHPSRALSYRVKMYQVLRKLDYHVIAFDYRGFADSSDVQPTEEGLVQDVRAVYSYLRKRMASSIVVWGHSLGTGVAVHAVADLCHEGDCPSALVLEAAFTSVEDEIWRHPNSLIFHWHPLFNWAFVEPVKENGAAFQSSDHIARVMCPILQLHAKDDATVPYELGYKLFQVARKTRPKNAGLLKFVAFDVDRGYSHTCLSDAPDLPDVLKDFFNVVLRKPKMMAAEKHQ